MGRQAAFARLRSEGWLSRQPPAFQDALLAQAEWRAHASGATIQIVGDEPAGLCALAEGRLSVLSAPPAMPHQLVMVAGPGWWWGDVALISDKARVVTIVARGPVEIVSVPRAAVLRLAEADGATWRRVAQITLGHLDRAMRVIGALSIPDARIRVAFALARLCDDIDRDTPGAVEFDLTQAELGELARMTRNAVQQPLKALQDEGLVICQYRRITVPSLGRLWEFIESEGDDGIRRAAE